MPSANHLSALRLAVDPAEILRAQGLTPDPWQQRFLLDESRRIMLLCCRGAGKSRTTSAKALHHALFRPRALVLLISRAQRQAGELFRYVKEGYQAVGRPVPSVKCTETTLELANGSRIVSLPGREETIRSFQGVTLLIKDEAARIPDDLNKSVTPMIAVSNGQEIDLSTPWGQRGWFWRKYTAGDHDITRFRVSWRECPRHSHDFVAKEEREHGKSWVAQEYECSFEALSGLVYPDFREKVATLTGIIGGRAVGGIDFGFRNPFAAIWGTYDHIADVLWISHERYLRECPLHEHARALPKDVLWYADPAHPTETIELRRAGFTVKKGHNAIAAGIAAVRARLETGRLRVNTHNCKNLLAEAELYRYPDADAATGQRADVPVDEHNHALGALRYLISRIDARFIAKALRGSTNADPGPADLDAQLDTAEAVHGARFTPPRRPAIDLDDPALWEAW